MSLRLQSISLGLYNGTMGIKQSSKCIYHEEVELSEGSYTVMDDCEFKSKTTKSIHCRAYKSSIEWAQIFLRLVRFSYYRNHKVLKANLVFESCHYMIY